ncbi:phenazine biosynthesis protein [Catenulispora rubra]|uniref:phenazine biosynthesis protein n=1 Tax=Catenulispora rubra TaxID=280293 RepID=UPI0018928079|nr:phenazine biosynthesis protein [Catenulispora rubra]
MTADTTSPTDQFTPHLQDILRWHFDPATGSKFWLSRVAELGFDPLADIATLADLRWFPDLSAELRTVPVDDLLPEGCRGRPFQVYESGGTVGTPKRIIEAGSRAEGIPWVDRMFDEHAFPRDVHWLHVGPTGPHIVGRSMRRLAETRGGVCFTIDFDPRWVKRMIRTGRPELAEEYIDHVLDQVELVTATQNIRVLFITPAVLEALCARTELRERLASRLTGLIWSGTSFDESSLRMVRDHYFPEAVVTGIYGNSLMGIAPQRPPVAEDKQACVFQPFWPRAVVEVVDAAGDAVAYGERGRVLVHLITREMFLPNVLERDSAIRVAPTHGSFYGGLDGLAEVAPYREGGATVIEGVY